MADDDNTAESNSIDSTEPDTDAQSTEEKSQESNALDRAELIARARAFLTSPQIVHEDLIAKRKFLAEKGLSQDEIEDLMRDLPLQLPQIPPRTYPQPPPSALPNILLGVTRILTWMTGGSVVLILLYYKFILPKLTETANARRSLKAHQISLLSRLSASLESLKASQKDTLALLPEVSTLESSKYRQCHSLGELDINPEPEVGIEIPEYTVLRCAIEELTAEKKDKYVNVRDIFSTLEQRYPWLRTEEGSLFENRLWDTINTSTSFSRKEEGDDIFFSYNPSQSSTNTPLISSLDSLKSSLTPSRNLPRTIFQSVLESLADLTGYISTQTYSVATSSFKVPGIGHSPALTQQEDEVRKEIRALKGLVLSRKSFTATPRKGFSAPATPSEEAALPSPSNIT